jgi:hypothetical protein
MYGQTCIKRTHLGQRKRSFIIRPLNRDGSIQSTFSMKGQKKDDLLIQVTV